MSSWFDDPFFDPSQHQVGDIHSHFDQMQRQMSSMMNSMFSGFGLGFDERPRGSLEGQHTHRSRARVEEVPDEGAYPKSHAQPIVEEPDDEPRARPARHARSTADGPQAFFYSSSMSTYSGADGVTHAKRKTYNSATGKTELAEMRKIGDQAVAMKREIDAEGRVRDAMDRRNLDESELGGFRERWNSREKSHSLRHARSLADDNSHRRALK
jgi:hypothetical protein